MLFLNHDKAFYGVLIFCLFPMFDHVVLNL